MREILFRGKRKDNGEWVEGYYSKEFFTTEKYDNISREEIDVNRFGEPCYRGYEVIPETIGQYTGLNDKNGNWAFEGDIIKYHFGNDVGIIRYGAYTQPFNADKFTKHIGFYVEWISDRSRTSLRRDLGYWLNIVPIIGNIYDNPELLEITD